MEKVRPGRGMAIQSCQYFVRFFVSNVMNHDDNIMNCIPISDDTFFLFHPHIFFCISPTTKSLYLYLCLVVLLTYLYQEGVHDNALIINIML